MNERKWTGRAAMMAALLCTSPITFGQDGLVAANDLVPGLERTMGVADTAAPEVVAVPITDDGRSGDELIATRQLVLSFHAPEQRACSVDILNERGQRVRAFAFSGTSAQKVVPVSVDGLAEGRYVARIVRGGEVRTVRFRR